MVAAIYRQRCYPSRVNCEPSIVSANRRSRCPTGHHTQACRLSHGRSGSAGWRSERCAANAISECQSAALPRATQPILFLSALHTCRCRWPGSTWYAGLSEEGNPADRPADGHAQVCRLEYACALCVLHTDASVCCHPQACFRPCVLPVVHAFQQQGSRCCCCPGRI